MRVRRSIVAAASAALVVGALPGVAATSAQAQPATTPAPPPALDATATLITGDKVTISTGPDGEPTVGFEAAARPDGGPVSYSAWGSDGHYYVVPTDVAPLVGDKLDLNLFDVPQLAALNDADADALPVIVQTAPPAKGAKAPAPNWTKLGVEPERTLESIDSVAGDVSADGAPALVDAVEAGTSIDHVWLDAPIEATDVDSMPQIGAPAAWAQGYDGTGVTVAVLDTGIDTTHPDLDDGIVTLARDFTGEGSTADPAGHGTHVASIIAGSGEASDGVNKGVAPGAHLLNGRVLDSTGHGDTSWAIDAMEWAASNGADVINMSLGVRGLYTDGKDPDALAVDSISARYDTLVVIAAGNEGGNGPFTVTTPGTADSALTVGAVDDNGTTPYFSSRGPRAGDWAIKPDIAAPGDSIVAALAAGTNAGFPVDDLYTQMSGTSMAAPHAAGAAAVLKSARPGLDGEAMKSVLMGSAHLSGNSLFSEGAGLVSIPDALGQTVHADPASLSFGKFWSPRAGQTPKSMTVTYTNDGDADVELHLNLSVNATDGQPVSAGEATLSADTLVVPARGTASVDVTVDPQADDPDVYGGVLTADGEGVHRVRTVLGFEVEQDLHTLHLEAGGFAADQLTQGTGYVYGLDDPSFFQFFSLDDGVADVRIPPGRYAVTGSLHAFAGQQLDSATLFTRDADLTDGDATIALDQSTAVPVVVATDKETVPSTLHEALSRTLPGRDYPALTDFSINAAYGTSRVETDLFVLPTGSVDGSVSIDTRRVLGEPLVDVSAKGGGVTSLDLATELSYAVRSPRLTGKVSARLVDAGQGTPAELAAAGVEGAVAVIEDSGSDPFLNEQAKAAHDAGASALIVYGSGPGPFIHYVDPIQVNWMTDQALPTLTLSREVGLQLAARARAGAQLKGTARKAPSYQYALDFFEDGDSLPASLTYRPRAKDLAAVPVDVHGSAPGVDMFERVTMIGHGSYSGFPFSFPGPLTDRIVYYSTGSGVTFHREVQPADHVNEYPSFFAGTPVTYTPGPQPRETYLAQVHGGLLSSPATPADASVSRDGDTLTVNLPYRVDGDGHAQQWAADGGSTGRFRVWQCDTLLTDDQYGTWLQQQVAPAEAPFRISLETHRTMDWWKESTDVTTEWGFPSGTTTEATILPLLQLNYGVLGLDAYNRGSRSASLRLRVSHQDGSSSDAAVTALQLWSSGDDGTTWTPVKVVAGKNGEYKAVVTAPKGATAISLKVHAQDAAGATFDETVIRAYALR